MAGEQKNPVMEQLPESKRTPEVETALNNLGMTSMAAIPDVVIPLSTLKGEADTMRGQLGDMKSKMEKMVEIPGEKASEEAMKTYHRRIGVPETATGYGIPELDATEEGKSLLGVFLNAGVTKASAGALTKGMLDWQDSLSKKAAADNQAKMDEWKKSLGDKAEKTVALVTRGAELALPGEDNSLARQRLVNDPVLAPVMAKIGQAATEHPTIFQSRITGSASAGGYKTMDERGLK